MVYLQLVGLVGLRSVVYIIIVHSIKYIFMHSVYILNYNCECFVLLTTLRTSLRRKVLFCLLQVHIFTFYLYFKYIFKGALYGIEPSTRNGKIWPTREEAAPSVPKNILLTFE